MIISQKEPRYLFIEVPCTGSTAISRELCENYDGVPILHKHAHYEDFRKTDFAKQGPYFVFAGIRNPLDETVSIFSKYKSNHDNKFTTEKRLAIHGGSVTRAALRRFQFVQHDDASFAAYFGRHCRLPYVNLGSLTFHHCDYILRFENLQEDFASVLARLGRTQVRPLPRANKTSGKRADFQDYFTDAMIPQAIRVFGPFMQRWKYKFPSAWEVARVPVLSRAKFGAFETLKCFYWKHLRHNPRFFGRLLRRVI